MVWRLLSFVALSACLFSVTGQTAESQPGTQWTEPTTGIVFVWVPGGQFRQGCQPSGGANCPEVEQPVRSRTVAGFWMSRTEITRGQWGQLERTDPSVVRKPDGYPVDQVHWEDAQDFLTRLNKLGRGLFRLPTEAEWEYACRGGVDGESYCGGNDLEAVAWYTSNSRRSTQPAEAKRPNKYGLYDMSGNLWEWTSDCWSQSIPDIADGQPYRDQECASHVLKGGSWGAYPPQLKRSSRRSDIDVKCPYIGLRLVRDAR
ncbi:MAG TPA: formylglycine-generating enzyme family protein [Candidatus Sulfotelmatobacter sp.]|jgi:formylglycine-generating enzyme required for sulfatase activity|nr:formylglycine-generating enzyme family protein [Candidatus Sulfotelmatobacter sp.]